MNFLQMSFSGSVIILVVLVLRKVLGNRLPRKAFLILWGVAVLRLMVPFAVSSEFSIYALLQQNEAVADAVEDTPVSAWLPVMYTKIKENGTAPVKAGMSQAQTEPSEVIFRSSRQEHENAGQNLYQDFSRSPQSSEGFSFQKNKWQIFWAAGVILCGLYFAFAYIKCRREFQTSLPVSNQIVQAWLREHRLRRPVEIRHLEGLSSPLTYGIFRPVILVPSFTEWEDREHLYYVLEHEFVHVQRLDALTKLLLTGVLCIHWFNPAVWVMYVLLNRDLELSCDEAVVRKFGLETRKAYAHALIHMEEEKSGLIPLYNGFGKNGIEERITAVMKLHKTSLLGIAAAGCLILAVAAAFGTAAKEKPLREYLTGIPGEEFTREESEMLFALWFEDYESLTAAGYREKLSIMTDTPEYLKLLDRFSNTSLTYEMKEGKQADALEAFLSYFHYAAGPLSSDRWLSFEFGDFVVTEFPVPMENASLEYELTIHILDENALTVGEYEKICPRVKEDLKEFLQQKTVWELREGEEILDAIDVKVQEITGREKTENVEIFIYWFFQPLTGDGDSEELFYRQVRKYQDDTWERTLAPYVPLGLTYELLEEGDEHGIVMYYGGKEVRGIWDEEQGIWISEHMGNSTYSSGAVELIAVYENGTLTGLREANPKEQEEWDKKRNAVNPRREETEEGYWEPRAVSYGTKEDYASLLTLKTPNYQSMPVEDFNALVLDWCNKNPERMERIGEDVGREDYQAELTEEERTFAAFTFSLSREENSRMVESRQTGKPRNKPVFGQKRWSRQEDNGGWCTLYYECFYDILDKKTLTVGERDRCVAAMEESVRRFWQETSLKELTSLNEEQVLKRLQEMAGQCGSKKITVGIEEDMLHFEHVGMSGHMSSSGQKIGWDRVELMYYEDTGAPYFADFLTNDTDKTITGIQYCMLAYDKNGNPLKLKWNFMDSSTESSYDYLVKKEGIALWPGSSGGGPGGWSLYDGPSMPNFPGGDGKENQAVYGLFGIRQITFGDGTIWENKGFEEWLRTYRGKKVSVSELKAYYPYKISVGEE